LEKLFKTPPLRDPSETIFRRKKLKMNPPSKIHGWQIHHHEKLMYQANAGTPTLRLKFYQYPPYRQTVEINKYPEK